MKILSAKFIKSVVEADEIFENKKPQIVFIGRSNVGKSSTINALTNQKNLARTSSFPGRTQEINIFLINKTFFLIDLPGYGFAKASRQAKERLEKLISWYLFDSGYKQTKVVLIIDASIGPTDHDLEMLYHLEQNNKEILIIVNKIDKIKKSSQAHQLQKIQKIIGIHKIIPFSAEKKIGINEVYKEILKK